MARWCTGNAWSQDISSSVRNLLHILRLIFSFKFRLINRIESFFRCYQVDIYTAILLTFNLQPNIKQNIWKIKHVLTREMIIFLFTSPDRGHLNLKFALSRKYVNLINFIYSLVQCLCVLWSKMNLWWHIVNQILWKIVQRNLKQNTQIWKCI